jgi:uncharacterized protein YbaA (DUF1428 family)
MSKYIDGFVIPVPQDKIPEYQAISEKARAVWMEYGALDYRECVAEDTGAPEMVSFPTLAGTKEGETVVFAYIVYESREHRDEVNGKVMADPRMQEMCPSQNGKEPPFDYKRMAYGGFKTIVGD